MTQQTMRAITKAKATTGVWMQDVPMPQVGHNDVLIRVKKAAICGTDVHIYKWDDWAQRTIPVDGLQGVSRDVPMTIGHEFMGEVVELGSEVQGIAVGDRVSAEGHITCGHCRNCRAGRRHLCRNTIGVGVNRDGAFADYISVPALNVYKLSAQISDDEASYFDAFGNATHTALEFDLVGEDVLITGAGPIGAMACAVAKHAGARNVVITDINDYRLDLAKQLGATRTVNVLNEDIKDLYAELHMTEGFDVGLEMSGVPSAFSSMLDNMNHGGSIAMLGIMPSGVGIDWDKVIFKGLNLKGIYGRRMFETWYKMGNLIESGVDIKPIITHRFNADDYAEAFEIMASGHSGKVILDFS